jgi:hypothetical protein
LVAATASTRISVAARDRRSSLRADDALGFGEHALGVVRATAASEHLLVTAPDLVVPRGLDLLRHPRFLILVDARKQLAGQLDALIGRESLRLFEYRMDVAAHESQLIAVSAVARPPVSLAPPSAVWAA